MPYAARQMPVAGICYNLLPHLFAAAFFAMRFRSLGESLAALAFPPFKPPSRPRATAAGFFS